MKNLIISLDAKTHSKLKAVSALKNMSIKDYLTKSIGQAIENEKSIFEVLK